jgi:RNA polymerase sigma-70 factor (ECF subfamily)
MMSEHLTQVTADFLANRQNLLAFINGLMRDPRTAEDIFQEVWLRLVGTLEKGVVIENPSRWCRTVAKNMIFQHWRDQRSSKVVADSTLKEFLDFVDQAYEENEPIQSLHAERQQALVQCLQALPGKSRRLVALKYEQSLALKDIATEVGQSPAAVIKALLRLRHALAACVEKRVHLQEMGL